MALADRLIGGRYRIVRKIAEGGMGEVFEAQHNLSKKSVALKILFPHIGKDEAARQRFLREVSAPAQIGHDAIVEVYDAGFDTEDGSLFVAMEFLEGEPLRDRLQKGAVPIEQLLAWFEAILDPLSAAHTTGIVHRDLKPENIFLQRKKDGSEVIKILDFGIARDLDSTQGNVTHTGIAMGTPHYMAPEQAMSAKGVSAAADVWALGAMLYEALAGRPPFDGETASAIVVNACTRQHAPLTQIAPHVPPSLAAFVDRCLDKEPRNRPQTAGDMLRELRAVRGGAPMSGVGGAATPYPATGPAMHPATGPYGGATPPPGGYTPQGTAVLPMGGGTPPPGYATPAPSGFGHPPSGAGYATGPAGFGSSPSAHGSWSGPGSAPGYATSSPSYGAPVGYATAAPASKGGGGMAIGVIAAVLIGGLVLVGGGIAVVVVSMSGDDSGGSSTSGLSTAQVRIETNVPAGEFFVDGSSRGTVVPGQQFRIERGNHTVEIREGGSTVASGTVNVVPGSDTSVSLMRVAQPTQNDPNLMVPGNAQTVTGQLRNGDEQDLQGKYIDRYPFDWTSGQQVTVMLDSADFDTYLRVVSPSGVEQSNDDREPGVSLNSGLTVFVTETGRWTVIATSYSGNVTGDYTLSVR